MGSLAAAGGKAGKIRRKIKTFPLIPIDTLGKGRYNYRRKGRNYA